MLKKQVVKSLVWSIVSYASESWALKECDEKRTTLFEVETCAEMIMVRWAIGVSLFEHRRNEEILEEGKVEPTALVMRRRRLKPSGTSKDR